MGGKRSLPQCPIACHNCRLKKARCSGTSPCTSCMRHEWDCVFPKSDQQRQRPGRRKVADIEDRLAQVERLLREQSTTSATTALLTTESDVAAVLPPGMNSSPGESHSIASPLRHGVTLKGSWQQAQRSPTTLTSPQVTVADLNQEFEGHARQDSASGQTQLLHMPSLTEVTDVNAVWNDSGRAMTMDMDLAPRSAVSVMCEAGTQASEEVNSEHHGDASYLGICSRSGVDWISRRTGTCDFISSAQKFIAGVNRTLKLSRPPSSTRAPEPDPTTAKKWITAFFEESFEHRIGLVQRGRFESKMQFPPPAASSDLGWYALRNIVYAIGSRLVLAEDTLPSSYGVARDTSWAYFENALSVHVELLYMRTDSSAVEALLLMAFFAEAISSPAVEYLLLSNAIRLAQSKGFHLPVATGMGVSEEERETRCWLWWCLYLFDQILTSRACRPPCINDADFDLAIPTTPRGQTAASIEFFKSAIQHARISSRVTRKLYSPGSLAVPTTELLRTTSELDRQIRQWWAQLPSLFRSRPTSRLFRDNPHIDQTQWIYINFAYHGTLCAIHNVITYPWVQPRSDFVPPQKMMTQVEESSRVVANASRAIASMTQQIEINAATHVWQAFYYPIVSHINLFLQILQNPSSQSAKSDLTLMEVVAGSISRVDFATNGDLKFSFPRDLTHMARSVIDASKEPASETFPGLSLHENDMSQDGFSRNPSYFEDTSFFTWENSEWAFQFPALGGVGLLE